jgi:excisionase family DNA binding protein
MNDQLMTAKQVAGYLNVNERTVLKLVGDSEIPGVKVGNQWRFRKAMIDAWLDDQMLGVLPRQIDVSKPANAKLLELASCFQVEHVIPDLEALTKTTVIEELAAHAHELGLVRDRTWFVGALIQRENVLPSAVGNGIAFPHTLGRYPEQVTRPFMVLGRSRAGIDFDALDNQPTHLFFVLGLKYEELHLPWLHKLSHMFVHTQATKAILDAPDGPAVFQAVADAERNITSRSL